MKCQKVGCGVENGPSARFCGGCGGPLSPDLRVRGTPAPAADGAGVVAVAPAGKSPGLAAVLCIVPGLGQVYNEDYKKGLAMFAAAVLLVATGIGYLVVLAWSAYDAYQVAGGTGKRWS
jgi:TM2 domain-containing membrane protein YozV